MSAAAMATPPSIVEEKLLKTRGVISAEVNVFSKRITVEFDASVIDLETIREIISTQKLP